MLVLISFGLVLVATVLLVLGLLVADGLALIYVSIACSLAAGVVLVVATRMARPQAQAAGGPAPLDEPATASTPAVAAERPQQPEPEPEPQPEPTAVTPVADEVAMAPAPAPRAAPAPVDDVVDDDDEDFFPIADYDDLTVSEIMPLLPQLYADELEVVEEREQSGKARVTILNRIEELREQLADAPADVTAAELAESDDDEWGIPEEGWDAEADGADGLPIAGYDDLTVRDITGRLDGLSPSELRQVRDHEVSGKARKGVLRSIDELLDQAPAEEPAPAPKKAAKKTAAKKTAAKKTAAKKAAAKKTPAKRSAAKKTSAKKAAAKKTSAKKTAAKKATRKR